VIDDCLKVTSYFGERERVSGRFFSEVLLDTLEEYDISTSILMRATGGFGLRHHLRTDQTLTMSEDPSVMAVASDSRSRVEAVLPRLAELQPRGMLTVERTRMVRDDVALGALPEQLHEATKLTIFIGRHERVFRVPAYLAICDLLHRRGVAGASVLMGVDGSSRGGRERAKFWDRNLEVPTMILAVGEGSRIQRVLPELGGLLHQPTAAVERVRVCKRDGQLLARPHELPSHDADGLALWQKLMIYTSESHLHDGAPVHRGIIRRLRETNSRGATSLRGVWGFHGDHEPHGDRLLQVGRRIPVVTVIVDTPSNIASAFDIIDELTAEHGLVTSEMVPAMQYFGDDTKQGGLRLANHSF
jgi:PII-like signaling protein